MGVVSKPKRPRKAAASAPSSSPATARVIVADKVHDGKGGFLPEGASLHGFPADVIDALIARGLASRG